MKVHPTSLSDSLLLEPTVYSDSRGFFLETWNKQVFDDLGIRANFVQDNHSLSCQGTLRGLHYQLPWPQGKFVWVIEGEVYDVIVDLRKSSPTFGKWDGFFLSAENRLRLWVPPGFAHGFYVTSPQAQFCYKCTERYMPEYEQVILWNCPELSIQWPFPVSTQPILSKKDSQGATFSKAPIYGEEFITPEISTLSSELSVSK